MNKLVLPVGAILGLAACIGLWYGLSGWSKEDLPSWLGGEAESDRDAGAGMGPEDYIPVADMGEPFETWPGKLECDAWERWDGFSRDKELLVSDTRVAYENGDTEPFVEATEGGTAIPAELEARFEWWRGDINGSRVSLDGWYTAGDDDLKKLQMTGTLRGGVLRVEGTRGPRDCVIEASRPDGNPDDE